MPLRPILTILLCALSLPSLAGVYELRIGEGTLRLSDGDHPALTLNGRTPGPTLRFKEGEEVIIKVTNTLDRDTSLHWHGVLLPYTQDGVPGISFAGIKPGETFTYRFPIRQSGTYWYHAHSDFQEAEGLYGALIIEPEQPEPYGYDRDYTLLLADWHDTKPATIFANLKKRADYYNPAPRTLGNLFADAARDGWRAALEDRLAWGGMRMSPTDISDVSGFHFLVNGQDAQQNWSGLFKPGERVRLRLINGSATSYFDIRIPGLKLTVVQADGNDVQPVTVDELRMGVAETYDLIVEPREHRAYTLFAEAMDRSGYARATLTPHMGMSAEVPALRERPLLTMADMGMSHEGTMHDMPMPSMDHSAMGHDMAGMDHSQMMDMDHSHMDHMSMGSMEMDDDAGSPQSPSDYAPGSGLAPQPAQPGNRLLTYGDLKALEPLAGFREPDRRFEMRLTGNMERYTWSFDGEPYSEAAPVRLRLGERVRIRFVNDTMMVHPIHLHGMWMQLDKGNGRYNPLKHTINVAPGTALEADILADAPGQWAFHCHLLYHMSAGMMRTFIVEPAVAGGQPSEEAGHEHAH